MTLEETIAHHRWAAENCVGEVRDEHLQMFGWLDELVQLKGENVKMRELVKELWEGYMDPPCEECPLKDKPVCADCPICAREAIVVDRMRELGIGVNE